MPPHSLQNFYGSLKRNGPEAAYYLFGTEDVLKEGAIGDLLDAVLDPGLRDFNLDRIQAIKTSNDRLFGSNEIFKARIKNHTCLPSANDPKR